MLSFQLRLFPSFQQPWYLGINVLMVLLLIFHALNGTRTVFFDLSYKVAIKRRLSWILLIFGTLMFIYIMVVNFFIIGQG